MAAAGAGRRAGTTGAGVADVRRAIVRVGITRDTAGLAARVAGIMGVLAVVAGMVAADPVDPAAAITAAVDRAVATITAVVVDTAAVAITMTAIIPDPFPQSAKFAAGISRPPLYQSPQ
jgi:hypothetical protein